MTGFSGIVTGGASGIGEAVVHRMLREGATVYAVDRDLAALSQLEAKCQGKPLVCVQGDVTDAASAEAVAERCHTETSSLAFLVNAAGVMHAPKPLHEVGIEEFDRVQSVNLRGCFLYHRAVVPHMLSTGSKGSIIHISSMSGIRPVATAAGYSASKHGLIGLTTSTALELAGQGIRVNAICPGVTDTPMFRANLQGGAAEGMIGLIPVKRLARSEDIANAVAWLISPEASYITGVALPVDGGLSLL